MTTDFSLMVRMFMLLALEGIAVTILYRMNVTEDSTEYYVRETSGYIALGIHCLALILAGLTGPRSGLDWTVASKKALTNLVFFAAFPAFSGLSLFLASNQNMDLLGVSGALNALLALFLLNWYYEDYIQANHQVKHNALYGEFLPPAVAINHGLLVEKYKEGQSLILEGKSQWNRVFGFVSWVLLSIIIGFAAYVSQSPSVMGWAMAGIPLLVALIYYVDVWQGRIGLRASKLSIDDRAFTTDMYPGEPISLFQVEGFRVAHEQPGQYLWNHESHTHQYYRQHRIRVYVRFKPGARPEEWFSEEGDVLIGDFHISSSSSERDAEEAELFINNALASINQSSGLGPA